MCPLPLGIIEILLAMFSRGHVLALLRGQGEQKRKYGEHVTRMRSCTVMPVGAIKED